MTPDLHTHTYTHVLGKIDPVEQDVPFHFSQSFIHVQHVDSFLRSAAARILTRPPHSAHSICLPAPLGTVAAGDIATKIQPPSPSHNKARRCQGQIPRQQNEFDIV